jgi:type IV fimbrial biogenesis protein FimT
MKTARYHGFTLIELMIALAIFAFLILLAGPQYADLMGNAQIRNGAENTLTGVRLAQTEALRGNTQGRFVLDPTPSTGGWTVWHFNNGESIADDRDANCRTDGGPRWCLVQSYTFADGASRTTVTTVPPDATQVTFNGLGRIAPNADASGTINRIDVTNTNVSASNRRPLRIAISSYVTSGVKLCDEAVTDTTDPRFCPTS